MPKLSQEEIVTVHVLASKGQSRAAIGRMLGVTPGAVRYHLRQQASGARDGRRGAPRKGART
jgi:predicted transcriptional regulator